MPNVFLRMAPDLSALINDIADQADDLLAEAKNRTQARAAIEAFLTQEHPSQGAVDRKKTIDGVMGILEREDFFSAEFVGDPFADENPDEA